MEIPDIAKTLLRQVPAEFVDDGCTSSPDSWFGWDFRWACRIHDWRGCTRCHPAGTMTSHYRKAGDSELRWLLSMSLPFRWRWVKWAYYVAVRRWAANAFDSCGPEAGDQCRHGMEMPGWMWAMQTSLVRTR